MKIGIIGTGSIAQEHVNAIRELQKRSTNADLDLDLVAVAGRDQPAADDFARRAGIPHVHPDVATLLADQTIDAVVVCSPTDLHAGQTASALRAGKHVLCEIPLATSLSETDALIALADRVDRKLMVCQTQRFFPPLIEARRIIDTGGIQVHAIVSRYLFNRRTNINWKGRHRTWTDNLIWHHGCHAVDAALWLLGADEVDVVCQVASPDPITGVPMNLTIAMRTTNNRLATVVMSYQAMLPQHDYLMIGEEQSLLFVDNELRSSAGLLVPAVGSDPLPDAMPRQNAEFFASIREGREPSVSARSVRPAMAALQAVQDCLDGQRSSKSASRSGS